MSKVNWSESDQFYWLRDANGDVLTFESVLDAQAAARQVETERAVADEVDRIVAWLCGDHGDWSAAARKFADGIERGDYK